MTDSPTFSLLTNLLKGLFGLFVAAHLLSIYKGYFKFGEEKEAVRRMLVNKYGTIMLIVSLLGVIFGLTYLIRAIKVFIISF